MAATEEDPMAPHVPRIVKHMNEDHADSVLAYVRHYGKRPDAQSASIITLNMSSMDISFSTTTSDQEADKQTITVPFLNPLESPRDARAMMVKMANEAAAALGISIKRD